MDFHHHHHNSGGSPSSSTTATISSTDPTPNHRNNGSHNHASTTTTTTTPSTDPMHTWWESISKARARIHLLSTLLPTDPTTISSLADSDRPARSLLSSLPAYTSLSTSLTSPNSGSGSDDLCHWLYDTFLSSDPDLRLVVLSFIPILAGTYLSRIHSQNAASAPSLAGFEAVLLSLYSSETKSRAGKPILVTIPDLSQPSLYHTPRPTTNKQNPNPNSSRSSNQSSQPLTGILSPPLEPQTAIKSTKRACIIGVALDCYYKQISQMPSWSKLDFCKFACRWAGQTCLCTSEFDQVKEMSETNTFSNGINIEEVDDDHEIVEELHNLEIASSDELELEGARIPLPWELCQPILRIVGHCLLAPLNGNDVKDAASVAVRSLYARATHDLVPQAILATRSLIQLDRRAREAVQAAAVVANVASNATTPTKVKKPEILLVSK